MCRQAVKVQFLSSALVNTNSPKDLSILELVKIIDLTPPKDVTL
jgi:hypothetical protein